MILHYPRTFKVVVANSADYIVSKRLREKEPALPFFFSIIVVYVDYWCKYMHCCSDTHVVYCGLWSYYSAYSQMASKHMSHLHNIFQWYNSFQEPYDRTACISRWFKWVHAVWIHSIWSLYITGFPKHLHGMYRLQGFVRYWKRPNLVNILCVYSVLL